MLTVIDEYTRECLAIEVARHLRSDDVLHRLTELFVERGPPDYIRSHNVLSWEASIDFGQAGLVARGGAGRRGSCDPSGLHLLKGRSPP
jgi:hypothetical protein